MDNETKLYPGLGFKLGAFKTILLCLLATTILASCLALITYGIIVLFIKISALFL